MNHIPSYATKNKQTAIVRITQHAGVLVTTQDMFVDFGFEGMIGNGYKSTTMWTFMLNYPRGTQGGYTYFCMGQGPGGSQSNENTA